MSEQPLLATNKKKIPERYRSFTSKNNKPKSPKKFLKERINRKVLKPKYSSIGEGPRPSYSATKKIIVRDRRNRPPPKRDNPAVGKYKSWSENQTSNNYDVDSITSPRSICSNSSISTTSADAYLDSLEIRTQKVNRRAYSMQLADSNERKKRSNRRVITSKIQPASTVLPPPSKPGSTVRKSSAPVKKSRGRRIIAINNYTRPEEKVSRFENPKERALKYKNAFEALARNGTFTNKIHPEDEE
eukprot:UN25802